MKRWLGSWRLRSLLIAVALLGALLGGVRSLMTRPYPIGFFAYGEAPPLVLWSDRKQHSDERGRGIYPVSVNFGHWISSVRWSDGATTYYPRWIAELLPSTWNS
ncbi:hypothetical protein P12x_000198 [Tundrisphaera lichenicola]|uniref:hypothetical protein n=1 Tax=Tundrisphaera lichenicola TaxID=2029860 RepID=UPI003EB69A79